MAENSSGVTAGFSFDKTNDDAPKQKSNEEAKPTQTYIEELNEKQNAEYVDRRSITIALVRNYSKFREANRSALPKRVD